LLNLTYVHSMFAVFFGHNLLTIADSVHVRRDATSKKPLTSEATWNTWHLGTPATFRSSRSCSLGKPYCRLDFSVQEFSNQPRSSLVLKSAVVVSR
jgi:hypothetical protein